MIKVYYGETPNVYKVTIAIAEMGLESERIPLNIFKGEQLEPWFLAISPNNRIPAIVDTAPVGGGAPISLAESGAILIYLAEKTGRFFPTQPRARAAVLQWVMWQMSYQGPMLGQYGHFKNYAAEKSPYGIERFRNEGLRSYKLLDKVLANREFLVDEYSIADMMCWPWLAFRHQHEIDLEAYPHLARWYRRIEQRSGVQEALRTAKVPDVANMTDQIRGILFNQKD